MDNRELVKSYTESKQGRDDHASIILALDKYQGRPDAERCPHNPEHGRLTVHGSGSYLLCGVCADPRTGQPIVTLPVDQVLIAEAFAALER